MKTLSPAEVTDSWSKLFRYSDGKLFWLPLKYKGFVYAGKEAGSHNKGYLWVNSKQLTKITAVHVIIWEMHHGKVPEGLVVDHRDGCTMNNKIGNLRLATRSQNAMNARGKSDSRSKLPKNVYVDYHTQTCIYYRAQVCVEGTYYRVGKLSLAEATIVAEKLRQEHHKEYANKGESYEV